MECLDLASAAEVEGALWEPFQIAHLNDDGPLRCEVKARQIAWSFLVAAEAVASAQLDGESTIFVSINQEEAKEKILYARRVFRNLQVGGLHRIVGDNQLGLTFANGARLISHPATPPRGKAKMNLVLDEFAHTQRDREIYTAALPVLSKGGRLRMGSSPLGASGVFWEVAKEQLRPYPGYARVQTPWWQVRSFVKGGLLPGPEADDLTTAARIARWGNLRILTLFENMPSEDFQQEFECVFSDESTAWIPWEFIRECQDPDLVHWRATGLDAAYDAIRSVKEAIATGRCEGVLVAGVDVGRKRNLTEIIVGGLGAVTAVRLHASLDRCRYDDQERLLEHLVATLPVQACLIDQNGIGSQLAESLSSRTTCEGVTFTNETKRLWATEARIQFDKRGALIPADRELAYQVHSIKRIVTPSKNLVFDTERSEKHHADQFWALALMLWAAREWGERPHYGVIIVPRA